MPDIRKRDGNQIKKQKKPIRMSLTTSVVMSTIIIIAIVAVIVVIVINANKKETTPNETQNQGGVTVAPSVPQENQNRLEDVPEPDPVSMRDLIEKNREYLQEQNVNVDELLSNWPEN